MPSSTTIFPPTQLDPSFQVKALPGLFFAGQINGTTGYEEAAGQGSHRRSQCWSRRPRTSARVSSADRHPTSPSLPTISSPAGVDEPYRLFTSRSEFRLTVRQDNALRRLAPIGLDSWLYTTARRRTRIADRLAAEDDAMALARSTSIRPEAAAPILEHAGSTSACRMPCASRTS